MSDLLEFLAHSFGNLVAKAEEDSITWKLLSDLDQEIENVLRTSEWKHYVPNALCCRVHCAYRTAVALALSGQLPESYTILRSGIECAIYSIYIAESEEHLRVWMQRNKSDSQTRESKQVFQYGRIKAYLLNINPDIVNRLDQLYAICIELGAHPNRFSVTANIDPGPVPSENATSFLYLNCEPAIQLLCLNHCSKAGMIFIDAIHLASKPSDKRIAQNYAKLRSQIDELNARAIDLLDIKLQKSVNKLKDEN